MRMCWRQRKFSAGTVRSAATAEAETAKATDRNATARKRCTGTPSDVPADRAEARRERLAAVAAVASRPSTLYGAHLAFGAPILSCLSARKRTHSKDPSRGELRSPQSCRLGDMLRGRGEHPCRMRIARDEHAAASRHMREGESQ